MSYLCTYTGKHFNYENIKPESIDIEDIAHALSNICRFNGHLMQFYSVAQHSVFVSTLVAPAIALEALLHDAAEAYLCDVPNPLKQLLPDYQRIESQVHAAICDKFNIPAKPSPEVKTADLIALATEKVAFNISPGLEWPILRGITPVSSEQTRAISRARAKENFLSCFYRLSLAKNLPAFKKAQRYMCSRYPFRGSVIASGTGDFMRFNDYVKPLEYYEIITGNILLPRRFAAAQGPDNTTMIERYNGDWVTYVEFMKLIERLETLP
jgi:5'-deoxynucleotidase YfbR-like HD superfamily hydrolase